MTRDKYPSYPDSGRDYAVVESARQQLRKPNKFICIYCHQQSVKLSKLPHKDDCPARKQKQGD